MNIGFIGIGIMGRPMAKNLLKAGYALTVYDKFAQFDDLVALGAKPGTSNKDVAAKSDLIITMLPNSPNVRDAVQHVVGRQVVDRQRSGLLETHVGRHGQDFVDRGGDELGVAAELDHRDHAVANLKLGHFAAHLLDDARRLVTDDTGRLRRVQVQALTGHDFGKVQPRRPHPHQDLPRAGLRIGHLADLEHFWTAVAGDDKGTHVGLRLAGR